MRRTLLPGKHRTQDRPSAEMEVSDGVHDFGGLLRLRVVAGALNAPQARVRHAGRKFNLMFRRKEVVTPRTVQEAPDELDDLRAVAASGQELRCVLLRPPTVAAGIEQDDGIIVMT